MKRFGFLIVYIFLFSVTFYVIPAQAQAVRTWVSGVGDDANPCSRTAPCKTFAGAISKTAAGGEISVLDPGGFGAVTITKSISIVNDYSGEAGILASNTNGVIINAGASDKVILRGLVIDGGIPTSPGLNGIRFLAGGALLVEKSTIKNFTSASAGNGILIAPSAGTIVVSLDDVIFHNNGGASTGSAIDVVPTGGAQVHAIINNVRLTGNASGFKFDGGNGQVLALVRNSVSSGSVRVGLRALGANTVNVLSDGSAYTSNGTGIIANGAGVSIRLTRSSVTANGTGLTATVGIIASYGDNQIDSNTVDGSSPTVILHK